MTYDNIKCHKTSGCHRVSEKTVLEMPAFLALSIPKIQQLLTFKTQGCGDEISESSISL